MKIAIATLHARRSAQAISLAAGCLAAALPEPLQTDTALIDLYPDQSDADIIARLRPDEFDLLAFPLYVWNRPRIEQLAASLKARQPALFLVAGGPEVTGNPAGLGSKGPWDALVCGDGETPFAALTAALKEQSRPDIPGVIWTESSPRPDPRPWAEPDMHPMPSPWLNGLLQPTADGGVLWEVARGCAFSCDYCFDARGHEGVRPLNFDRLEAELEQFATRGVSQVWVLDSTFNYPPERGAALLELLLAKAPHCHYHLEAKADYLDRSTVRLLGQLNCSLQIGLQTTNPAALKVIHRPLDLERLNEQIHLLALEGITFGFDLIYGLPGDDLDHFRQSLDLAIDFAPNHLHIFPLAVLPGTRLAQHRERHGLVAADQPPYEIRQSASWSPADLEAGRRLATAVDLFYNTGRAVAFLPDLLKTLEMTPSRFFEIFMSWLEEELGLIGSDRAEPEGWTAKEVYQWQQRFLAWQLKQLGVGHLATMVLDLLCYHYHYAETLLGEDLPLPASVAAPADFWESPWRRAEQMSLVPFSYEILDLLEMEGADISEFNQLFRPTGSVALFWRRDNEVNCESLEENFLRLLQLSDGERSPREIFSGTLPQATGEELVAYAVAEGFLTPVGP